MEALESVLEAVRMRAKVESKTGHSVAEERNAHTVRAEVCMSEYVHLVESEQSPECVQVFQTTRGIRLRQSRIMGETGNNVASLECRTSGYAKLWLNTPI